MPKTFDGIQALQYLKQGYAVRLMIWGPQDHIRVYGNQIVDEGLVPYNKDIHYMLDSGPWEFYCNPTAEGMEPTPGTWEWAKAAIEQGKKVRKTGWGEGALVSDIVNLHMIYLCSENLYATDWEEYIEPQAPKKGMTWEEARVAMAQGKKVRRAGWKYESARAYWPLTNSEDEEATDWEVVEA